MDISEALSPIRDQLDNTVGIAERSDYTAVGGTVNMAARLEGLTKSFEVDGVVSSDTAKRLTDAEFELVGLGEVEIPRPEPTDVSVFHLTRVPLVFPQKGWRTLTPRSCSGTIACGPVSWGQYWKGGNVGMRLSLKRLLFLTVLSALCFPASLSAQTTATIRPTTDELTKTKNSGADWITNGGALNNERYSTLDQINTSNVSGLKGAWLTRLNSGRGSKYVFEADPIVIDGIMYIPTGNDDIFALDAVTGKKLWEWNSDIPQVNDLICCGWDNRGVSAGEGMVFTGLLDGSFAALDQKTGQLKWRTQLEDYHDGYSITGAPRYYDGLVFTGMSGGENGIRGRLYALDAKTGKEMWRFYTIPAPGEFGSDTWPSPNDPDPGRVQAWTHGGATIWQSVAIDPELGMLYFSTGNAGPQSDGAVRPGDNLFTASIVALDYKTGAYKWHFQEEHHEIWDDDAPSPVVLFDQVYNGVTRKGLYECGKTSWCYFLDRANGQPLIGITEQPVKQEPRQFTSPTQPVPVGDAFAKKCADPLPSFPNAGCHPDGFWDVPLLMPGNSNNWSPTSFDVLNGNVYVMASQSLIARARKYEEYQPGKRYVAVANVTPIDAPITSTLTAMDSRTNKIVWQHENQGAQSYGAVTTAGGLLFVGQVDGNLMAFNANTGDPLWKFQTGWGISAPPMTYSVNGTQYVAVAAGGNRGGNTTLDGDAVWSFALNGTVDEVASPPPIQTKTSIGGALVHLGNPIGRVTTVGQDVPFEGTVRMEDYFFLPTRPAVPAGTTLNFLNNGSVVHTATDNQLRWDTGDIAPGQTVPITFDTEGTYTFTCTPHPWMLAQVVVQ